MQQKTAIDSDPKNSSCVWELGLHDDSRWSWGESCECQTKAKKKPVKGRVQAKKITWDRTSCFSITWEFTFFFSVSYRPIKVQVCDSPQVVDGAEEVGFHSNGFGFGASEVRLKREKGSTQSTPWSSVFFFCWFSFFFILKGLELSGDFGNWTTPGTAFVFVFFSRWLPAQSSFFPVGLGPPLCSFLWAMPPAGMGATGRYEACGMLDFDCMVGWQPVLTIFQYHFSVKESSIGRWWLNSIFLGWCLSSFVSAYFNLWVYAVRLSFQEYSQLGP